MRLTKRSRGILRTVGELREQGRFASVDAITDEYHRDKVNPSRSLRLRTPIAHALYDLHALGLLTEGPGQTWDLTAEGRKAIEDPA